MAATLLFSRMSRFHDVLAVLYWQWPAPLAHSCLEHMLVA